MSQEKRLSDVLKERLDNLETENKALKMTLTKFEGKVNELEQRDRRSGSGDATVVLPPQPTTKTSSDVHGDTGTHLDHVLGCKNCNQELSKEIDGLVKCKGCDAVVRTTSPKCPFCGSTEAKR